MMRLRWSVEKSRTERTSALVRVTFGGGGIRSKPLEVLDDALEDASGSLSSVSKMDGGSADGSLEDMAIRRGGGRVRSSTEWIYVEASGIRSTEGNTDMEVIPLLPRLGTY